MTYDPAFMNTASCRSAITFIDGDKGILEYRGYPIEQLAEKSTYLETAYLLLNGELPTKDELDDVDRTRSRTTRSSTRTSKDVARRVPLQRASDGHADRHRSAPSARSIRKRRTSSIETCARSRSTGSSRR